jgi:hypothetical protein
LQALGLVHELQHSAKSVCECVQVHTYACVVHHVAQVAQDIEGVWREGQLVVVQARPQVLPTGQEMATAGTDAAAAAVMHELGLKWLMLQAV